MTLKDGNAQVVFDWTTDALCQSWAVDGVNQLKAQGFWYRLGGDTQEQSIRSLGAATANQVDTNADGDPDLLRITYASSARPGLTAEVVYTLMGGAAGIGESDMGEQIRWANKSGSAITRHFFQYADMDLGGSPDGDSVQITGGPRGQ